MRNLERCYSAATYAVTSMPVGTISATGGIHVRRGVVDTPEGGVVWLASTPETPGGVASSGRRSVICSSVRPRIRIIEFEEVSTLSGVLRKSLRSEPSG